MFTAESQHFESRNKQLSCSTDEEDRMDEAVVKVVWI